MKQSHGGKAVIRPAPEGKTAEKATVELESGFSTQITGGSCRVR